MIFLLLLLLVGCGPQYRHVQQPPYSTVCTAAVAAMLTGDTMVDYYLFQEKAPGRSTIEELRAYLQEHGMDLERADRISKEPAVLVVTSEPGNAHAVLWTGKRVHDPAFQEPGELYSGYSLMEVWRVVR